MEKEDSTSDDSEALLTYQVINESLKRVKAGREKKTTKQKNC